MKDIDILEEKEKEAIKDLKEYLHWEELQGFSMLPRDKHIETLLNLVETLIAENKELKVNNKKLQDKCKELIFEKQELTSALLDSTPNDKIKAKIEEINKEMLNEENSLELFYRKKYCKEVLQSLLGKE